MFQNPSNFQELNHTILWHWIATFLKFKTRFFFGQFKCLVKLCREKKTDYKRFSLRNFCGIYSSPSLLLTVEGIRLSPFPLVQLVNQQEAAGTYLCRQNIWKIDVKKLSTAVIWRIFKNLLRWINKRPPVYRHINFYEKKNLQSCSILIYSCPFSENWSTQVWACCDLTSLKKPSSDQERTVS